MPSKPSIVLGISYGHGDSSAALIVNQELVAAAEEERFKRVKHYALFPIQSIQYCLKHAGLTPNQVKVVAIARKPWIGFWQKIKLALEHPNLMSSQVRGTNFSLGRSLTQMGFRFYRVKRVEHHLAHMWSSRYLSNDPELAFLSFDGLGDFVSAAIGQLEKGKIKILNRTYFPDSLGFFYTAMTHYLGFPHFGDEYKVMGLSAYGSPNYLMAMRELVREKEPFGFTLNPECFPLLSHPLQFKIEKTQPVIHPFYSSNFLTQLIGITPRKPHDPLTRYHWDLAKSVQVRFEELGFHLLKQLHKKVGGHSLALSGGCAHNSVWVGKIPSQSPFNKVYVAPACHDAGIAVGAAMAVSKGPVTNSGKHWALLGPDIDESEMGEEPKFPFQFDSKVFKSDEKLIQWMVVELTHQKIIGLFHGRMEFGPRALGHRSIICDPRDPKMKDMINEKVKHRELFRPFAASVLWEYQDKWFKNSFYSPTMEAVFEVRNDVRAKIPAVVHVDHSCRIQSVVKEIQPFYSKLLEAFRQKTGIPMLLNTSFNDSEPIVCSKQDALNCFLKVEIDHLVIGQKVYSRQVHSALAS